MQENWKRAHKTIPAAMILLIILAASMFLFTRPASASTDSGAVIDLFTQKTPSGRGINQSSNGFEPQELVILYANVTYNGIPVANKNVAFEVSTPTGATFFSGSNATDANGIAMVSFRLPTNVTFGIWVALGSVDVAGVIVHDWLPFRVGWIITITNIATLNAELKPQTTFLRQDVIVFNLTVENTALTNESSTITVDVQDANHYSIIHSELTNLIFTPGKNYVLSSSKIPTTAAIGLATVSAAAYKAPPEIGGVLYSPAISSTFEIALVRVVHDIAVTDIKVSNYSVLIGETVQINVTIVNKGTEVETFNVSTYYNSFLIETLPVSALEPASQVKLTFTWNTTSVKAGYYQISASAPLLGDITPWDNTLVDGVVQVKTKVPYPPPPIPCALLLFAAFTFILVIVASLILLLLLFYLERRRRKKPPKRVYAVVVRLHI
jgi:hypothetical protein